jgi:hypothetical protein
VDVGIHHASGPARRRGRWRHRNGLRSHIVADLVVGGVINVDHPSPGVEKVDRLAVAVFPFRVSSGIGSHGVVASWHRMETNQRIRVRLLTQTALAPAALAGLIDPAPVNPTTPPVP